MKPVLTHVYLWANGMVMAFDQRGQQMPEYQGHVDEVREKIEAAGYKLPAAMAFPMGDFA